jgi:phosphate transport system substrate-binding protein
VSELIWVAPDKTVPAGVPENRATIDLQAHGSGTATPGQFIQHTKPARKLMLVGFTDSVGTTDRNIALSLERANVARQTLLRNLRDPQYAKLIEIRGYGPALPVACNGNEAGRDKNRRVEVWVR